MKNRIDMKKITQRIDEFLNYIIPAYIAIFFVFGFAAFWIAFGMLLKMAFSSFGIL